MSQITPTGMSDFDEKDIYIRNFIFETSKKILKLRGATQIETPVAELYSTVESLYGEEFNKLVYTFDDEYELELLAPGLEKRDIDIDVDYNNVMTISAEADDEEKEEKRICQRQEFANKGFKRSFQLPEDAISDDITAIYRNGIISLFIPKKEELKGK